MSRAVLAAAVLFSATALAQSASPEPASTPAPTAATSAAKWRLGVEVDPLPFVLQGYSVVVGVRPAMMPNLRFGLGTFGARMPDRLIAPENAGFSLQVSYAVAANALWYFSPDRGGFYAGLIGNYQMSRYTFTGVAGSVDLPRMTVGAEVGFQWLPFQQIGLYLNPWLGVGYGFDLGAPASLGGKTYAAGPISPLFGIHVGYEFEL